MFLLVAQLSVLNSFTLFIGSFDAIFPFFLIFLAGEGGPLYPTLQFNLPEV